MGESWAAGIGRVLAGSASKGSQWVTVERRSREAFAILRGQGAAATATISISNSGDASALTSMKVEVGALPAKTFVNV